MNPKEIFSAAALLVVIASSLAAQTLFPAAFVLDGWRPQLAKRR
jgi:hypothetical protein